MIYLKRNNFLIRELCEADIEPIVAGEIAQGWLGASREKYDMRLRDAAEGRCAALCAELQGRPVGYVNLYFKAYPPYAETAWPEIVDFGVLEIYRNRGIGTALMDAAEALAAKRSDTVCLGVGLHSGYGAAQRMYVKRGYIPDGTGAWYRGKPLGQYAPCVNDDDLNLYFTKRLH